MDTKIMNEEIINDMRGKLGNNRLRLPSHIQFLEDSDEDLRMLLPVGAINENMQSNDAAFEGWAVIVYTYFIKSGKHYRHLILDVEEFPYDRDAFRNNKNGNCNRFLYRVLKFREQYVSWFRISERLKSRVELFDAFLNEIPDLINNTPEEEGNIPAEIDSEAGVEYLLTADEGAKFHELFKDSHIPVGDHKVNRQLPVGLFIKENEDGNAVFPGDSAAIDMWTWNQDTFYAVELKKDNKTVGTLSEVFFYVNYMRDLLLPDGRFTFYENGKDERGYGDLKELVKQNKIKRIGAVMLLDKIHPFIRTEVLDELNHGAEKERIQYYVQRYEGDAVKGTFRGMPVED